MSDRAISFETGAVREQLLRILGSDDFDAPKRNRRFLAYAVEETLEGRAHRLKAYNIATSVFGRKSDFDPHQDAIVRIEAGRLRRSLERYYLKAGTSDLIHITIPRGSYGAAFEDRDFAAPAARLSPPASGAATRQQGPSVLVSPFEIVGDPSEYPNFAHGFTRQVIVALTRFTDLRVFGPHTSFLYGSPDAPPGPGANLDIDFLVMGATTLSAGHFCVEALLVDAHTGRNLWAQTFERDMGAGEIVGVRDELANTIARSLAQPYGVIFNNIARDADATLPDQLTSYDLVIQSYVYERSYDRDLFEPVRTRLERVIAAEPHYAEAFARLSQLYTDAARFGHDVNAATQAPLERALKLARRAVTLAPESSHAHLALALAYWFSGDTVGGLAELELSRQINPNDTEVMAELGLRYAFLSDWLRAEPLLQESFTRNPAQPSRHRFGLALCHYIKGEYEKTLDETRRLDAPQAVFGFLLTAAAAGQLGRRRESLAAVDAVLVIDPDYADHMVADLRFRGFDPGLIRHLAEGVSRAGLRIEGAAPTDAPPRTLPAM